MKINALRPGRLWELWAYSGTSLAASGSGHALAAQNPPDLENLLIL